MILETITKLILAIILAGLIGYEREKIHRAAGLRTHILVCLASTLLTISPLSLNLPNIDPTRIAAAIITGIGFIGAGAILQSKGKIIGITTAASLFFIAGIGITLGFSQYLLAIISTILAYLVLIEGRKFKYIIFKK
jgi:putative Mg2+ transporter-C (MgtC) family protein